VLNDNFGIVELEGKKVFIVNKSTSEKIEINTANNLCELIACQLTEGAKSENQLIDIFNNMPFPKYKIEEGIKLLNRLGVLDY